MHPVESAGAVYLYPRIKNLVLGGKNKNTLTC